jgi:hypothetical protein
METRITLDSEIAALADAAELAGVPDPINWIAAYQVTGCSRTTYYRALEQMMLVAGERLVAGYQATANRARNVRHLAYSEGWIVAPARTSKVDAAHRSSLRAWGYSAEVRA